MIFIRNLIIRRVAVMSEIILPQVASIGIYNSNIAVRNKTITEKRKTTMFEIDLPIEAGGIAFVDSEQSSITPNMVICVKPGQERHTKFPFKCYYIHMILEKGELYDILMNTPTFILTSNIQEYLYIFKSLCNHREIGIELNNVILQSLILKLIYALGMDSKKTMYSRRFKNIEYDKIEKSIEYITEHISEDLSLGVVSSFASYSPIHFHNCFKTATGKTLHEYIQDIRINKSIELLSTTSLSLAEIALQCGFSSQSYFSYVFKKKMKMTPRDYVRKEFERYPK